MVAFTSMTLTSYVHTPSPCTAATPSLPLLPSTGDRETCGVFELDARDEAKLASDEGTDMVTIVVAVQVYSQRCTTPTHRPAITQNSVHLVDILVPVERCIRGYSDMTAEEVSAHSKSAIERTIPLGILYTSCAYSKQ